MKKKPLWFCNGDFEEGMEDLGYRELYVRWLQYGVFTPLLRSHGTDTPREIWRLGEEGTPFYDTAAKYIRLRYTLLPYIYSLAAGVTFRGCAMMKPLGLEFPDDEQARDLLDQYLFGDFMVCPVTELFYYLANSTPIDGVEKTRTVYLPEGIWYDFHTEKKLTGGKTILADAPLDILPLYLRAGAILVTGPVMQYTDQFEDPPLTVTVCPGADGSFILYHDDGETYGYRSGEYEEIRIDWNDKESRLTISDRTGAYPNMPEKRELHVRKIASHEETTVCYCGEKIALYLK